MKCPRCTVPLEWKPGAGAGLNCCPSCQGLWLDSAFLSEVRRNHEVDLADDFGALPGTKTSAIMCPGDGARMLTLTHLGVEVDTCPECKGLWLDKGEWEKLVETYRSRVSKAGIAAAAVGGAAVLGGTAALAGQRTQSSNSFVTRNRGSSNQGDVVCDVVEASADGLLEGAFSLIGTICSSIFD
ncbi:MAG: hypothetical protein CSYNP_03581 [Syntrophus sp. SKADARSKE-3]|nr:hypothetical protein [Syntrophus sp. SKADARSKE-3]